MKSTYQQIRFKPTDKLSKFGLINKIGDDPWFRCFDNTLQKVEIKLSNATWIFQEQINIKTSKK
jgi:hypothetical protein